MIFERIICLADISPISGSEKNLAIRCILPDADKMPDEIRSLGLRILTEGWL